MTVYFIGAGPGAADLLTLRADRLIRSCGVCLYAGSIVPGEVLEHCPDGAEVYARPFHHRPSKADNRAYLHPQAGRDRP